MKYLGVRTILFFAACVHCALLVPSTAHALSCAPTSTRIGVIKKITEEDGRVTIQLRNNVFAFDESEWSLASYREMVAAYINEEYDNLTLVDQSILHPDIITMQMYQFEHLDVDIDDIIVHGPPFDICDYGLNAFFDPDGTLLSATIKSQYDNFPTDEPPIEVYPGRTISCSESNICTVEINFSVDEEDFSLRPGDTHAPDHEVLSRVIALDASLPEPDDEDHLMQIDPWGFHDFADYVLIFHERVTPEMNCDPYVCTNGEVHPRCTDDGHPITYLVHPCQFSITDQVFIDVDANHSNAHAIEYVKEQHVVQGYPDGSFKPDALINRAEFTKIIIAAVYEQEVIDQCALEELFSDVTLDDWFGPYVCTAKMEDVISGYPDGTFKPSNEVNFAEAAKIVVNAFSIETDPNEIPSIWWKPYVYALAKINSLPPSFSDPNQKITRGDMAEIIYRVMTGLE